jgi:hypothetical protein
MTTRREFLKTGIAGGLLLNIAACTRSPASGNQMAILTALVPVFLAGALPADGPAREALIARTVAGVGQAIAGLAPAAQKEIGELFDLLGFAPTRIITTAVWPDWPDASPPAIGSFLESWRHSRFALFRSAYAALHDLVFAAWYARPESWAAIAYPGPPKVH